VRRGTKTLVLDELREDGQWRPFSMASWVEETPGEYTITVRVRVIDSAKVTGVGIIGPVPRTPRRKKRSAKR